MDEQQWPLRRSKETDKINAMPHDDAILSVTSQEIKDMYLSDAPRDKTKPKLNKNGGVVVVEEDYSLREVKSMVKPSGTLAHIRWPFVPWTIAPHEKYRPITPSYRALASIEAIRDIEPIPGCDYIDRAKVLGRDTVVAKGQFKNGDLVMWHRIGTVVPDTPTYSFLKRRRFRIKSQRIRGVVSDGIALEVDHALVGLFDPLFEGQDITSEMGIIEYRRPKPREKRIVARAPTMLSLFMPHPKNDDEKGLKRFMEGVDKAITGKAFDNFKRRAALQKFIVPAPDYRPDYILTMTPQQFGKEVILSDDGHLKIKIDKASCKETPKVGDSVRFQINIVPHMDSVNPTLFKQ